MYNGPGTVCSVSMVNTTFAFDGGKRKRRSYKLPAGIEDSYKAWLGLVGLHSKEEQGSLITLEVIFDVWCLWVTWQP